MRAVYLVLFGFLLGLACSLPAQGGKSLASALRSKQCRLSCEEIGQAAGAILKARLQNSTQQSLQVVIPEGTLFVPPQPDQQTRMSIQEERVQLNPGGEAVVNVLGVCVEYGKPAPAADGKFLGSAHPAGGPILDAWDAGRHTIVTGVSPSRTMTGRGWLMQQAVEGVPSSVKNFISQGEYKTLLRALTDWGAL